MNNEITIKEITQKVEKSSTNFEKTNTDLKRKYLLWNIEAFNIVASKISANRGTFGTGYPFYALDENLDGKLPIIEEQIRYNRQLVRNGETVQKSIWECKRCLEEKYANMPDLKRICKPCPNMLDELKDKSGDVEAIISSLQEKAHEKYAEKEKEIEAEQLREIERIVMLKVVDQKWMDHIDNMDELRKGIGLQGWGQKDPVVQYRIVGTEMFDEMIEAIKVDVVKLLMNLRQQKDLRRSETAKITKAALQSINSVDGGQSSIENPEVNRTVVREEPKVGRNDLCPCGSGKKYKNCCGRNK